jgi:RHS repeat-associated protein
MRNFITFSIGIALLLGQLCSQAAQDAEIPIDRANPRRELIGYHAGGRGANHQDWFKIERSTSPNGQVEIVTNIAYVELASGMHYWGDNQWKVSDDTIEAFPGGAVARRGQHKVIFGPNANAIGAIDMEGADGTRLRSHVVGLCYIDKESGRVAVLAYVKNSEGEIRGRNQVVYRDAFDRIRADLRYTVTRAGFEQDVILRERPPTPESLGLNPEKTLLTVFTEFDEVQTPTLEGRTTEGDETLVFGSLRTVPGKAFSIEQDTESVPVIKKWVERDGRKYLFEEVQLQGIRTALDKLPVVSTGAARPPLPKVYDSLQAMAMPKPQYASSSPRPLKVAKEDRPKQMASLGSTRFSDGFVIDYQLVSSSITNYTFRGDLTYHVSGVVNAYGTTTFEGGTVIKYTNGAYISLSGPISCSTGPYRPAVLTAIDDNSVGETIQGSTGEPAGYYATYGLLMNPPSSAIQLNDLKIRYTTTALGSAFGGSYAHIGRNIQFYKVGYAFGGYNPGTWRFENILATEVGTAVVGAYSGTFHGVNWTVDKANQVYNSGILYLTNSILGCITNWVSVTGACNSYIACDSDNFVTVGAGSYYLPTNSPCRNAGTTNIDPILLASLRKGTTYPPTVYTNVAFSSATALTIQATRDTDTPDLGYHYEALDYLVNKLAVTNASLTVSNGVAIGAYLDNAAIFLQDSSLLSAVGTPSTPIRFTFYNTVQEQPVFLSSVARSNFTYACLLNPYHLGSTASVGATGEIRFGRFSSLANSGVPFFHVGPQLDFKQLVIRDCEFGEMYGYELITSYTNTYALFANNLFQRTRVNATGGSGSQLVFSNNLFWGSSNVTFRGGIGGNVQVHNNAFDSSVMSSLPGFGAVLSNNFNAYLNCTGSVPLTNAGPSNVISSSALVYQSGALGSFYQQTNSPLLNMGSTNANLVALYHYTTTTNQLKETNSVVDIGYHYVAVDNNGNPLDSDGDGTADYAEDINGNGSNDAGETLWNLAILSHPQSQAVKITSNAIFSVYAEGLPPLQYQWFFNGTNSITGATNASLTLTNVFPGNAGQYSVRVTNGSASITSSVALLTVTCMSTPVGGVSWWAAESNALDSIGTNHGTIAGNNGYATGKVGMSFQFDGTNNYVAIPDSTSLKPQVFTWEGWINFKSSNSVVSGGASAGLQYVIFKKNTKTSYFEGYTLIKSRSSGVDRLAFTVSSTNGSSTQVSIKSTTSITTNIWYHFAAARGSNFTRLYVNGVLEAQTNVAFAQDYGTEPVYFGTTASSYDGKFAGRLDEVGLYHSVLSANEIAAIYQAGATGKCPLPPSIVKQPASRITMVGNTVSISVLAAGGTPLSYQWFYDGTNTLAGATNATLTLENVQHSDAGQYSVQVSNSEGSVESSTATLSVMDCFSAVDVALVVDRSSSMNTSLGGGLTRLDAAKIACSNFVNNLNFTNDQAALFTFDANVLTNKLLTNSAATLLQAIGQITSGSGTWMSTPLLKAQVELAGARHHTNAGPIMVFLSDGEPDDDDSVVLAAASEVKNAGTRLITIALTTEAGTNLLKSMASDESDFYIATNATQLNNVYDLIAGSICRGTNGTFLPWVQINSPTNGQLFSLTPTNILISATATNPFGSIDVVRFYAGTNYLGLATSASNNVFEFNWAGATAGVYTLKAIATNNFAAVTNPVVITNNAMPVVSIISPTNIQSFTEVTNVSLRAIATDAEHGTNVTVSFYYTNALIGTAIHTGGATNSLVWSNRTADYYSVVAVATDGWGAQSSSGICVFKVNPTNTPPTVGIPSPTNGSVFAPGSDITISASVTNGSANVVIVEFFANGVLLGSDSSAPYSLEECCWKSGTHELVAKATDALGAWAVCTNTIAVVNEPLSGKGYWDPRFSSLIPTNATYGYSAKYAKGISSVVGSNGAFYGVSALTAMTYADTQDWLKEGGFPPSVAISYDDTNASFAPLESIVDPENASQNSNGRWLASTVYKGDLYVAGEHQGEGIGNPKLNVLRRSGNEWRAITSNSWFSATNAVNELNMPVPIVTAIEVLGGDVYVAGNFTNVTTFPASNTDVRFVAKYDAASDRWVAVATNQLNGPVLTLTTMHGQLYAGGLFTAAGGNTNFNCVALLSGNTWIPLGNGIRGSTNSVPFVASLASCAGELFAGGRFTIAGNDTNAWGIAIWDGMTWRSLGGGPSPYGYTPQWNGMEWIQNSGTFSLDRWYVSGSEAEPLPVVLTVKPRGRSVFIGGAFSAIRQGDQRIPAWNVAQATWSDSKQNWTWSDLDGGTIHGCGYTEVRSLAIREGASPGEFDLLVGGDFEFVGQGRMRSGGYALWRVGSQPPSAPKVVITSPANGTAYTDIPEEMIDVVSTVESDYTNILSGSVALLVDGSPAGLLPESGPAGIFTNKWTIPNSPLPKGLHSLVVAAEDAAGLRGASAPVYIHIKDDENPITLNDDYATMLANGPPIAINVLTNDSTTNPGQLKVFQVFPALGGGAGEMRVAHDRSGVTYQPKRDYYGKDVFLYATTDGLSTNVAYVTIKVCGLPAVAITSPYDEQRTNPPVSNFTITGTALDLDGSVSNVTLLVNGSPYGQPFTNGANGSFATNWTQNAFGFYTFEAVARDNENLTSTSAPVTLVLTAPVTNPPVAIISNLTPSATMLFGETMDFPVIRDGFSNLVGTASGDNPIAYQLLLFRPDDWEPSVDELSEWIASGGEPFADLTTGPKNYQGFHTGGVTNGLLGTLDFSGVPNGIYDLVLRVRAGTAETNATVRFRLETDLKIGQFTFSEQDLVIPVNGMPLTVVRTYDSMNPRSADFGYGWTYALNSLEVELNETRETISFGDDAGEAAFADEEEEANGLPKAISIRTGGGHDVTLTLPDGRRTTFAFSPRYKADEMKYYAEWESAPGVRWGLRPLDSGEINVIPTLPAFWQDGGYNSTFKNHDIKGWVLTNVDGSEYTISRGTANTVVYQDEPGHFINITAYGSPKLTEIKQRSGDRIAISESGVSHYNATNGLTRSMLFERDTAGRLKALRDPVAGTNGHPVVTYAYDSKSGNLVQVSRLQDRAVGNYFTTKYHYDNPNFPHYITSIEDPRGITIARNEYDSSGKLVKVTDADGKTTQFVHNTTNKLEMVIDRLGFTNTFVYDLRGNVTASTNALGQASHYAYDDLNQKTNEIIGAGSANAIPQTNRFAYDENGFVTNSISGGLVTNVFNYDSYGNLLSSLDGRGNGVTNTYDTNTGLLTSTKDAFSITSFAYDTAGRQVSMTDALGNVTTNVYDGSGNLTYTAVLQSGDSVLTSTSFQYDANGNQTATLTSNMVAGVLTQVGTINVYDAQNRVIHTIDALGNTNSVVYGATGRQEAVVDKVGVATTFEYDAQGRLYKTSRTNSIPEYVYYDANGQRTATADSGGVLTRYGYDAAGRTIAVTNAWGTSEQAVTRTIYDDLGRVLYSIDARGVSNRFVYDGAGRRVAATNAVGTAQATWSKFGYDAAGNQVYFTNALSQITTNVYDVANRLVAVQYPDGTRTGTRYDALGRRVAETNQANIVTWFAYDGLGRLTSVTNALTNVTRYAYDGAGQLLAQVDALNRTNRFQYDAMSRRIKRIQPSGQTESFGYDALGNVLYHTNFNGVVVANQYDVLNRLLNRSSTGGYDITYSYTTNGLRETMADPSGSYGYVYDSRNRLRTNTTPAGTLVYDYDANGNQTRIRSLNTSGSDLTYQYDSLNRLTNVVDARSGVATPTTYGYDTVGNLQRVSYGNGLTNLYQYDSLHRLTNLTWKVAGAARADFAYKLALAGNRTNLSETINSVSRGYAWQYDQLYRLTNETITGTAPTGALGYGYDAVGNRTNRTSSVSGLGAQSLSYNTNDWLTTDSYDSNGNTLTNGSNNFSYDKEDRLTSAYVNGVGITVVYNGDGMRVAKITNGVTVRYLVADRNPTGYAQVLEEVDNSLNVQRYYGLGNDLSSQTRWTGSGWETRFFGYDGHGSVRFLTDTSSGAIIDTYTYDAYGTQIASTGSTPNNYRYSGEQWDADLGLYYLRARYMNPGTGRFWTMDAYEGSSEDPLSLHKYLYCHADPVNGIDPSGHFYTVIEAFAVNVGNFLHKNSDAIRGQFTKAKIKSQIKDILEDQVIDGIYVIIVEPQLGVLVPYIGQGKDLKGRIPQSVTRLMDEFGEEAVRAIRYLPIDTSGISSERARKFVRETSEQYVINLLSRDADPLNKINPVSELRAGGRFKKHFKKVTKEWFKDLFEAMQKSRVP